MEQSGFFLGKDIKEIDLGGGTSRKVLAHNDKMLIAEVHFEKDSVGTVHSHVHTQCTYVVEGSFVFSIDGKEQTVKKGDSIVFESNVKHGCKCIEEGYVIDIFNPCREDFLN